MNRPTDQPYNIILTGPFGVGKTTIFKKLSSEMHLDCRYESVSSVAKSMLHLDKWTHTAHVDGTEIKVGKYICSRLALLNIVHFSMCVCVCRQLYGTQETWSIME